MNGFPRVDVRQVALAFRINEAPLMELELGVLHGLSARMYKSGHLFDLVINLLKKRLIKRIAVVGGDGRRTGGTKPKESWIGSDAIVKELISRGIHRDEILLTDPITNSREEAIAICKLAQQKNFRFVGSISVAYHGGRMLPYMVKVMRETNFYFYYYMILPTRTDWTLKMKSSQGIKITNCFEAACEDAVKIETHIANGWAAPFEDVIAYLNARDALVLSPR